MRVLIAQTLLVTGLAFWAAPLAAQAVLPDRAPAPRSEPRPAEPGAGEPGAGQQGARQPRSSRAEPSKPEPSKPEAAKPEPARLTLDELFARLSAAKTDAEAKGVAALIQRRWSRSGSDTADLLMSRADEATTAKNYPLAVELLDRVLVLEPGWAEAWNRRATAFYLNDDPTSAMADISQVLAREPRHFGALAGLGHIYMASGDEKRALQAYRRALAVYPQMTSLKTLVERLSPGIDGRDI